MLIDADKWTSNPIVVTGSYNWSDAAETGNDENMLIIHSTYFADLFMQEFAERYHEAGGLEDFKTETRINETGFSCIRERTTVNINFKVNESVYSYVEIDFEGEKVYGVESASGAFKHINEDAGVYSLIGIKSSGVRVMLAQSSVSKSGIIFSVISQGKIGGSRQPYTAKVSGEGIVDIKVVNMLGEIVYIEKMNLSKKDRFVFNKAVSAGIYHVIFENKNGKITERIMRIR